MRSVGTREAISVMNARGHHHYIVPHLISDAGTLAA
jgi:hypothetical protein